MVPMIRSKTALESVNAFVVAIRAPACVRACVDPGKRGNTFRVFVYTLCIYRCRQTGDQGDQKRKQIERGGIIRVGGNLWGPFERHRYGLPLNLHRAER